jgi:hypothetical protein
LATIGSSSSVFTMLSGYSESILYHNRP